MNIKNFFKFIKNPYDYINSLAILNAEKELSRIAKEQFLTPIDQTGKEDIFIVGFPKSGSTWMQSLISGIVYGTHTDFMSDHLAQEIVPDVHARTHYKRLGKVNFFKSHHLPNIKYKRVIYIVRDGRDAMVSYYHFNRNRGIETDLEQMIVDGDHIFPSKWHQHVRKWKENPFNAEMITIRYEDLLTQPLNQLYKLCDFINIERSDELLESVIKCNHIDKMRSRVIANDGMANKSFTGSKGAKFFRKGKTKNYLQEMNLDLQKHFLEEASKELHLFNYE